MIDSSMKRTLSRSPNSRADSAMIISDSVLKISVAVLAWVCSRPSKSSRYAKPGSSSPNDANRATVRQAMGHVGFFLA